MSRGGVVRGDGVGIEVTDSFIRGVRLRHDVDGRVAQAVELPFVSFDDGAALDSLVLLRAELGEPREPTRIATFSVSASLQRVDVTGRGGPELNDLRTALDRRHGINSTMLMDDGPRRWLLLIRWDALSIRRLEDLAERAGFVDVTVEPSPLALARVLPTSTTFMRRLVAQSDAHHVVTSHGLPVAASGTSAPGRPHPDMDVSDVDVPLAWFDDLLEPERLAEVLDRVAALADSDAAVRGAEGAAHAERITLRLAGDEYPDHPPHDLRSPKRQCVALGAAVGAAGLAGTLRPVDINVPAVAELQQFDRPWAVERLSDLPDVEPVAPTGSIRRLTKSFRPRRNRR